MRILILGAGALGGLVGAQLARAGEDVVLLEANAPRARMLREHGLLISRVGEEEACVPLNVVTSVSGLAPFELVFVAVKTYETEDAVRSVVAACTPETLFLSLQNGAGNAEKLAALVGPARVLCGITYHSIQHAGPRRLQYRAGIKPLQIAPFVGEPTAAIETIAAMFRRAGLNTDVAANVEHAIWHKLLHNAVVNPTSALTGLSCREMLADPDLMSFMRGLCDEIVVVMRAKGIPIVDEEDPFRPITGSLRALGKNRPSMWQDLSRGKRTEVDALNGAVVAEAVRLGLSAPHNAAITRFIHSRERQTFIRKEQVVQQLGIVEHRPTAAVSLPPRRRDRASGPRFGEAPPLESTRKLKELIHEYYVDLAAASDDPRRRVAACSSLAPVEILRALDVVPYLPEHHAALISMTGQSPVALARAAAEGYSPFANSGMRADIGALLAGLSPLTATHGIPVPPRPDLVVYSTNAGHDLRPWFEFYESRYGVPIVGVHFPPGLQTPERADVDAATAQLARLIERTESVTGRSLDVSRLADVVDASAQASLLWRHIVAMARAAPAPLTYFEMLAHLGPLVLLRGTPEAVDYYRMLAAELEDRAARGIVQAPDQAHRFYWEGPPVWCARHTLAEVFAARGVAIVGSSYVTAYALTEMDGRDPLPSMAAAYAGVPGNRSEAYRASRLAGRLEEYGVDAVILHQCRTSHEASHLRNGLWSRVQRLTCIPGLVLEADAHDARLFSVERLERQLADFIEEHRERFADRLVAC